MNAALCQTIQELLADLEKTFPYASALWMRTEGTRASLDRKDQSLNPQDPDTGIVFTIFNGPSVRALQLDDREAVETVASFPTVFQYSHQEFASSEVNSTKLVQSVKSWASDLPRPGTHVQPSSVQGQDGRTQGPPLAPRHSTPLPPLQSQTFMTPMQRDPATLPVQEKLQTLRYGGRVVLEQKLRLGERSITGINVEKLIEHSERRASSAVG